MSPCRSRLGAGSFERCSTSVDRRKYLVLSMAPVSIDITRLSEEDLVDLNRRIVERLRLIRSARQLVQLARCTVGLQVEFTTDDGRIVQGAITKLNRKTATVCCSGSGHWRVSPSLLRAVTNAPDRLLLLCRESCRSPPSGRSLVLTVKERAELGGAGCDGAPSAARPRRGHRWHSARPGGCEGRADHARKAGLRPNPPHACDTALKLGGEMLHARR